MSESQRNLETSMKVEGPIGNDAEVASALVRRLVGALRLGVDGGLDWIGRTARIGRSAAWGFYYGKRKTAGWNTIQQLRAAYLAVQEQQLNRLVHEIKIERAKGRTDAAFEDIAAQVAALKVEISADKPPR